MLSASRSRSLVQRRAAAFRTSGSAQNGGLSPWRPTTAAHGQHLQVRPYIYLPTSLDEFLERFQRWIEKREQRFVEVKLLSREKLHDHSDQMSQRRHQFSRFVHRNEAAWKTWYWKYRHTANQATELRLPDSNAIGDSSLVTMSDRYQGWKARRKEQYHGWKMRRQEQYRGWKKRGQEQLEKWKLKEQEAWIRTKQVILTEYSRPEWFDELGRPLTSRDSTGRFVNPWQSQSTNGVHSVKTLWRWQVQRVTREIEEFGGVGSLMPTLSWNSPPPTLKVPSPPLPTPHPEKLQCTWLGHSMCWIQMNGVSILTDPMFSLRASPFQTLPIGVPRDLPASHSIDELVEHAGGSIDVCCISHDHYDHMDQDSVQQLSQYVKLWVVPLGIGKWLHRSCGIPYEDIVELEWWEQAHLVRELDTPDPKLVPLLAEDDRAINSDSDLTITSLPAMHWGSRTMSDRNKRLWCSFGLNSPHHRMFFCGDTAYPNSFPLFRQIGDALGPFDLACIPIGAYEPVELNKDSHVNPSEAVKIHRDILSLHSVGIHWGTFQLSEEDMNDPPKALKTALDEGLDEPVMFPFDTVVHGGSVEIDPVSMHMDELEKTDKVVLASDN